ncbi:MAG: hypothetical protein QOJ14_961, partial [Thermoleophilaceae bacterium]|nr:hypothetical protein [Thermoleophilaceae bacterium]
AELSAERSGAKLSEAAATLVEGSSNEGAATTLGRLRKGAALFRGVVNGYKFSAEEMALMGYDATWQAKARAAAKEFDAVMIAKSRNRYGRPAWLKTTDMKAKSISEVDALIWNLPDEVNGVVAAFKPGKKVFENALKRLGIEEGSLDWEVAHSRFNKMTGNYEKYLPKWKEMNGKFITISNEAVGNGYAQTLVREQKVKFVLEELKGAHGEPIYVPKVELPNGTRLPYAGDADFVDIVKRNGAPMKGDESTRMFNHIQDELDARHGYTTTWTNPEGESSFATKLQILAEDCSPCIAVTADGFYAVRPAVDKAGKLAYSWFNSTTDYFYALEGLPDFPDVLTLLGH